MRDRPLAKLRATERALQAGQPVSTTPRGEEGAFRRLGRKIEQEGFGEVVVDAIAYVTIVPVFFLLRWPLRAIWILLREINEPIKRFSASHGIAKRVCGFFDRHKALAGIIEMSIVMVWLLPVIAFAVRRCTALFPGWTIGNIATDVRSAWLLVGLSAAALALGVIGNGPIATEVTEPHEVVDLGSVGLVIGMGVGPPVVLALWAYGLL
jgi:hypothetical protein